MSFRLVSEGWGTELENALRRDRSELRIVSPFIKHPALQRLLALRPERIRVVTRFDLEGFARSVSDVAALRTLLESGASVRGLRALHAKLYIFGDNVAVVTSANLTVAGLDTNPEFGIVTEDPAAVRRCRDYFDDLWHRARDDLRLDEVDRWTADLARYLATGADRAGSRFLPDYGVDVVRPAPSRVLAPSVVTTRASYRRRVRRERFEWPPEDCIPGSPWTGGSLRFGNRLRRTFGCGSTRRLSA